MSFILDALKKAESERSRHNGPVLMDVRIASGRQGLPTWAWVLGCLLLANLLVVVLAWLLLRKPATAPPVAAAAASVAQPAAAAATIPVAAPGPAVTAPLPAAAALPTTPTTPTTPIMPATPVQSVATPPVATPLPAPQPVAENLPTMQEVVASGVTLPAMQLNLHVYDDVPAGRYVLLNGRRLREGDELSDGIRVERITPRGVVLNASGRRFLLPAGG